MILSFAYIQGQEGEALAYYEQRLQITLDSNEKKQLEEFVKMLREKVEGKSQGRGSFSLSGLSLHCPA